MAKRKEKIKDTILLNKMYSGEFTENNIGHEIINFFKTDDKNENYIYVLPYGGIAKKHNDKIEHILLTSPMHNGKFDILAKVENPTQINYGGNSKQNSEVGAEQRKFVNDNSIKYGGKFIYDIMEDNKHNDVAAYVTFKATNGVIRAKEVITITQDQFNLQRSKGYATGEDYTFFKKIIDTNDYWETEDKTTTVNTEGFEDVDGFNFLQLIKKEDDENIISNLFCYYLKNNKSLLDDFCERILQIPKDNYSIKREVCIADKLKKDKNAEQKKDENQYQRRGRIDLWLESDKVTVVIENKVKSGINGSRHDLESEATIDQLVDYCRFSEKQKEKKHYYFIFAPNYNEIETTTDNKYSHNNNYIVIRYKEIYDYFKNHAVQIDEYNCYSQFINALAKHIYTADKEMERRFVKAINKAKNSSNT